MKFFISHSSQDKELVLLFVDLLTKRFHVDINDIFCTSMDNALKIGEDFIKGIKGSLHDSEIVLFLITENYISSKFCIMEMGAAWAYKDNIVPIIVPPLDFSVLNDTPLKSVQSLMLDDAETIFNRLYVNMLVEKNIIPRLSFMQEHELLNGIEEFTKAVKKNIYRNYGFDFKNCIKISVAQNGDPEAVKMEYNEDEEVYKLYCNFKSNEFYPVPSNFISYIFQFVPHKDWSAVSHNDIFQFECRSKDLSIKKVIVEFKYGDVLYKFYESAFEVTDEYRSIHIPIDYALMPKKYLKDISEVCFVIRPTFVDNYIGQIEFRNLQFQGSKTN